jgi:MFS family permease
MSKDISGWVSVLMTLRFTRTTLSRHVRSSFERYDPPYDVRFCYTFVLTYASKIDVRLVPFLALLYLAAHIDRANIGNAKIEGLDKDLKLTGYQYNIALSIFFVPYILFEIPSNLLLKKFNRPSHYLGMLITTWGIVMTLTGVVQNYGGLVACRFLLGVAEAGFFPGAVVCIING